MELKTLGEVIAERRFVLATEKGQSELTLRLGLPKPFPDGNGYYAPFEISGLGPEKIRYAAGVDAIQALQGALKMAGVSLHFYRRGYGNGLRLFEEGDDLGFPGEAWTEGLAHQIILAFRPVCGLKVSISRNAGSMKNFQFGDIKPHPGGKGTVGQYALHIQCPWRLVAPDHIVTGSADWWEPAEHEQDWEKWNRERPTPSLQDRVLARLFNEYDPDTRSYINRSEHLVVEQVDADDYGGLNIDLSGGYQLQVFPNGIHGEDWRLFEPGNENSHFVIESGRFGQREERLRLLTGKTFFFTRFAYVVPPDDVHCQGCWRTLSTHGPGEHQGYVTAMPMSKADQAELIAQDRWERLTIPEVIQRGIHLYWICPSCFDEFRDGLQFKAMTADSPEKAWDSGDGDRR